MSAPRRMARGNRVGTQDGRAILEVTVSGQRRRGCVPKAAHRRGLLPWVRRLRRPASTSPPSSPSVGPTSCSSRRRRHTMGKTPDVSNELFGKFHPDPVRAGAGAESAQRHRWRGKVSARSVRRQPSTHAATRATGRRSGPAVGQVDSTLIEHSHGVRSGFRVDLTGIACSDPTSMPSRIIGPRGFPAGLILFLVGMITMTISVKMLKNKPRIPQPNGLRPFTPAITAHTIAAMMLPIATSTPFDPFQDEPGRFRIVLRRQYKSMQHAGLLSSCVAWEVSDTQPRVNQPAVHLSDGCKNAA